MRYELFLRRASALDDHERARLKASADDCPALACELIDNTGSQHGADLGVEAEAVNAADLLLDAAFEHARALSLSIYDPQLNRMIGEADRDAVTEKIAQLASFSAAGVLELGSQPQVGSTTRRKLWLALGGSVVVLLLLMRALHCAA